MMEELRLERLVKSIQQSFRRFCDLRTGENKQYDMVDVGMGAFSVFFTQSASFLPHQEDMEQRMGRILFDAASEHQRVQSANTVENGLICFLTCQNREYFS